MLNKVEKRPWYAIRINGSGFRIHRRRVIVPGPKGGVHRFSIPDIAARMAVQVEMDRLGIECVVPVAYDLQPHRRKRREMTTRTVPLVPGYAFVRAPKDWQAMRALKCVSGVVELASGEPVRISDIDMHALHMAEWESYLGYVEKLTKPGRRRKLLEAYPRGSRHLIRHELLGQIEVKIMSVSASGRIKAIADRLGKIEFGLDDIEKAA